MSTWLITGSSSGLGRAVAGAVLDAGHNAVVDRPQRRLGARPRRGPPRRDPGRGRSTSPTPPRSRPQSAQGEERFGGDRRLVNNAGYGYRAAVEEGDEADVAALFATNVFGPVALIKAVLPGMRARRRGAIVNISSIGARICPPGSGYYAASQGRARRPVGVAAQGARAARDRRRRRRARGFRTDFAGRSLQQSATVIDDYAETAGKRRKEHDTAHGTQPGDPARAARAILTAVEADEPPALLMLGTDALTAVRAVIDAQLAELNSWEKTSLSTDFPSTT